MDFAGDYTVAEDLVSDIIGTVILTLQVDFTNDSPTKRSSFGVGVVVVSQDHLVWFYRSCGVGSYQQAYFGFGIERH